MCSVLLKSFATRRTLYFFCGTQEIDLRIAATTNCFKYRPCFDWLCVNHIASAQCSVCDVGMWRNYKTTSRGKHGLSLCSKASRALIKLFPSKCYVLTKLRYRSVIPSAWRSICRLNWGVHTFPAWWKVRSTYPSRVQTSGSLYLAIDGTAKMAIVELYGSCISPKTCDPSRHLHAW